MALLCFFNQILNLLSKKRSINLTSVIAFTIKALHQIADARALPGARQHERTLKRCQDSWHARGTLTDSFKSVV